MRRITSSCLLLIVTSQESVSGAFWNYANSCLSTNKRKYSLRRGRATVRYLLNDSSPPICSAFACGCSVYWQLGDWESGDFGNIVIPATFESILEGTHDCVTQFGMPRNPKR